MPAWWGRKSSKNKDESQKTQLHNHNHNQTPHGNQSSFFKLTSKADGTENKRGTSSHHRDRPKSFEDVSFTRGSPRGSRESAPAGSSRFLGCESESGEKKGLPLPRPSFSSIQSDHGLGPASASGSVSSESSSGSSDDHQVGSDHGQLGGYRIHGDAKFNTGPRSPGPGSRGPTSPTSPLHSRLSLESPTGRHESQGHPLPLPPGSPTSPSAMPATRTGVPESSSPSLSKWKKGRLLGRGTFGHVYLGFNSEKGQMCAIKEVRVVSDDQASKECLKQLNQEINLLSQLSHPNIVRYHGSNLDEETLSVYLEYVSGGSIHKLLQEYGAFKEPVIQNYTRQILSGLAYLHGRNTVHRDIKGANILVDPNGEIKLADFGMAKHITACSSMLSFKGSPYWMAPEVVMNTNGYSLAVDIWSLGCTILEMATSRPPWSQYEGVAAIFKIGNSKDIPEIPDLLSKDAKNFVKLCLQRDPLARPTASQLLDHPFIRDQTMARISNSTLTHDAFPYAFDGSRTLPALELHLQRPNHTGDGDYRRKPLNAASRVIKSPRENVRAITSLPVSPCSSPLRKLGPAHKSCFLSPPHPIYMLSGQSSYNQSLDFPITPLRPNRGYTHDSLLEPFLFRAQAPNVSTRSRPV